MEHLQRLRVSLVSTAASKNNLGAAFVAFYVFNICYHSPYESTCEHFSLWCKFERDFHFSDFSRAR